MSLIPMIARVHLEYGGKAYAPREYFEALPIHAAVLNYQQKAALLPSGHVQTRDLEPEPDAEPASEPEIEPEADPDAEQEPSEPEPTSPTVKRKRTYKRRDMKAQR